MPKRNKVEDEVITCYQQKNKKHTAFLRLRYDDEHSYYKYIAYCDSEQQAIDGLRQFIKAQEIALKKNKI